MLFNTVLAAEVCWTRRKHNAFRMSAERVVVASVQSSMKSVHPHLQHIVLPLAQYIACVASLHFLIHWVCLLYVLLLVHVCCKIQHCAAYLVLCKPAVMCSMLYTPCRHLVTLQSM